MEITELIRDYKTTKLLSNQELDFLEVELWETFNHIDEVEFLAKAPNDITNKLELPIILVGNYAVLRFLIKKDQ